MKVFVALVCLHWSYASFLNNEYFENGNIFKTRIEFSSEKAVKFVNDLPLNSKNTVHFTEGNNWTSVFYCDSFKSQK